MTSERPQILERIAALEAELVHLRQQVASSLVHRLLPDDHAEVMACRVGGQQFGLLLDDIDEVLPVAQLTPLPEAEPWILGSLNLRGESVVVVDTMQRLLERTHLIRTTEFIVVCRTEWHATALLVDEILDIHSIVPESLRHPAPGVTFAPYLFAVLHVDGRSVPLLDASRLAHLAVGHAAQMGDASDSTSRTKTRMTGGSND